MSPRTLHSAVITWFDQHKRDLPWRDPECSPWGILVSEVMLQQTPVVRVLPRWKEWMCKWPTPKDLAQASTADVLKAWDRLGYPRRALRLQECAKAVTANHGGQLPATVDQLRALPGIGEYTAAAVASFAYGQRAVVVDTNIRRVLARAVEGKPLPSPTYSAAERALATTLLPTNTRQSVRWNAAVMELGALVCTARKPLCQQCPLHRQCAWVAAGSPAYSGPARATQAWHGTDRQVRGTIMRIVREEGATPTSAVEQEVMRRLATASAEQFERSLKGLVTDGLVSVTSQGKIQLPV